MNSVIFKAEPFFQKNNIVGAWEKWKKGKLFAFIDPTLRCGLAGTHSSGSSELGGRGGLGAGAGSGSAPSSKGFPEIFHGYGASPFVGSYLESNE